MVTVTNYSEGRLHALDGLRAAAMLLGIVLHAAASFIVTPFPWIVRDVSRNTMIGWNQLIGTVTDPAEKIRRVCDAIPDHIKKYADHYHVLHGALSTSRDKKVIAVMKEHYREIEDFFSKIIAEGQKAGNFQKGLNPKSIAWHFITTGIGYAMVSLNLGQIDRPMVEAMIESMLRGMRN